MLPANVMVVEDALSTGRLVVEMLGDLGHGARLFKSAEEGLEALQKRSFDVVLSDVFLPGLDGIEMVRRMRDLDPMLVPIIMTGKDNQEIAVRAMGCGIRFFLKKPFGQDQLKDLLVQALCDRQRDLEQRRLLSDLLHLRSELQERVVDQHRQLSRTEGYLSNLLDAAPFAILSVDRKGRILTLNSTAQEMYQYQSEEILGKEVLPLFGEAKDSSTQERCFHQRRDGTCFPVLVRQRRILDDRERHIAQLYIVEDLSEQEELKEQLLYAERLSVLGQMAPRIAHEFKTPLQLIVGFAQLTQQYLQAGDVEQGQASVQAILPAAQELVELVQQIANLGKPKKSQIAALDLAEEIEKILQPMQQLGVLKYCQVAKDFAPSLPRIQGDATQIEQVFRNLIVNAVQAMEGRGERLLRLGLAATADGRWVHCRVDDTGEGIPAENLDKIFQPFFTTKPQGKGTGLGLPIVKSILDRHGAGLRVESQVGEGTCFHLSFPAVQS